MKSFIFNVRINPDKKLRINFFVDPPGEFRLSKAEFGLILCS